MSQNEIPSEPLIYPEIDFNFEEKQKVTEHIHIGIKVDCFDSLLGQWPRPKGRGLEPYQLNIHSVAQATETD